MDFESILKKFEDARVDSNTYRSLLNGLSLTPIAFQSRRGGQYLT
jgi:hypothetical protein